MCSFFYTQNRFWLSLSPPIVAIFNNFLAINISYLSETTHSPIYFFYHSCLCSNLRAVQLTYMSETDSSSFISAPLPSKLLCPIFQQTLNELLLATLEIFFLCRQQFLFHYLHLVHMYMYKSEVLILSGYLCFRLPVISVSIVTMDIVGKVLMRGVGKRVYK